MLFFMAVSFAAHAQLLLQKGYCCPASVTSYNGGSCIKVCFPSLGSGGDACYNTKFGGISYEMITISGVNYYHGEANTAGTNCQYYSRTAGTPVCTGSGVGSAVTYTSATMSVYDVGTATTSNTYSCTNSDVLPVELLMFDAAKAADRKALVQWQTQQDGPFFYQKLQRSTDGQNWEVVYTEKVVQSSTSLINRVYSDRPPTTSDLFYYRLQLVDEDGLIKYSPIKPVQFDPLPNTVSVFPNPVKDILSITGNSTVISKLELYDRTGRLVRSPVQPNSASATVSMGGLAAGIYMLKVTYGGTVKSFKIEKL